MQISITDDVTVMQVQVPTAPQTVQVQVPGTPGPPGPQGIPGQANVLTIGTVTTLAPGANATSTISGVSPNQTLNLGIPAGTPGATGATGATPQLASGTINALAWNQPIGMTITGTAANPILNLSIPKGRGFNPRGAWAATTAYAVDDIYTQGGSTYYVNTAYTSGASFGATDTSKTSVWAQLGATGSTGPVNTLAIGTVSNVATGGAATASITGTAPNQTLNLGLPIGATGAAALMTIGTVTTLAAGASATASVTGTAPNFVLNLGIPQGANGSSAAATTTSAGIVQLAGDLSGTSTAPTVTGGTHHTHTASQLSDSTTVGRSVLTAVDAPTARTAIGAGTSNLAIGTTSTTAKAGDYQPTSANISDSTTVGRAVLTAIDAPTARTAIGAGTSSLALGTTNTTAKAGDYQPTSANISDATSAATANMVIKRDANGRASVADPSATTDIATKNYADTQDTASRRPVVNAQTASYTLALADERKIITMNVATANTVTVPPNSSVAFPIGTVLQVQQIGAGVTTITPGAAVTLQAPMGLAMRQYQTIELQKTGTDTWDVMSYGNVTSSGGLNNIVQITQANYTALGTKDATTLYVIVG